MRLAEAPPHEILQSAVVAVLPAPDDGDRLRVRRDVSSHMLAEIEPRVRVFNLDTGYQFAETLGFAIGSPNDMGSRSR